MIDLLDRYSPQLAGEHRLDYLQRTRCMSKVGFSTRKKAENDLQRVVRKYGNKGKNVYFCPFCHRYHVGFSRNYKLETELKQEVAVRKLCPSCREGGGVPHLLLSTDSARQYAKIGIA